MNNRELLESAAKAAGKKGVYYQFQLTGEYGIVDFDLENSGFWNPIEDDGDAFRLASSLGMTVEFGNNCVLHPVEKMGMGIESLASTRLAITKCAAVIGRAMG